MSKEESLSKDLNFVKEFEELKLKQKILIEALNSKNKTEMNQFLLDINSKLDFLVKIFKESQEAEEEDTFQDDIIKKADDIINKFEELDKKLDEKFEAFEEKFDSFNSLLGKTEGIVERNLEHPSSTIPSPNFKFKDKNLNDKKEINSKPNNDDLNTKTNINNSSSNNDSKIKPKSENSMSDLKSNSQTSEKINEVIKEDEKNNKNKESKLFGLIKGDKENSDKKKKWF